MKRLSRNIGILFFSHTDISTHKGNACYTSFYTKWAKQNFNLIFFFLYKFKSFEIEISIEYLAQGLIPLVIQCWFQTFLLETFVLFYHLDNFLNKQFRNQTAAEEAFHEFIDFRNNVFYNKYLNDIGMHWHKTSETVDFYLKNFAKIFCIK